MAKEIVVDTNFIISCIKFRIYIDELYSFAKQIVIMDPCLKELEAIAKAKGRDGKNAKAGVDVIKKLKFKIISTKKSCDESIVDYAKKRNAFVATNDRNLIKNLKNFGTKIIRIRQSKYMVLE